MRGDCDRSPNGWHFIEAGVRCYWCGEIPREGEAVWNELRVPRRRRDLRDVDTKGKT